MAHALLILLVMWPALAAAQIPVLHVSPASLAFVAAGLESPPAQQVRIRNLGSGVLRWKVTAAAPWIRVSPASGTGPSVVTVAIDAERLGPGHHDSRVTIDAGDADDSPVSVAVTAEVTAPVPGAAPALVPAASGIEAPAPAAPSTSPQPAPASPAGAAPARAIPQGATVRTPLRIDRQTLPPATRHLPYAQAIPVAGGTPPYAIRLVRGRLPLGLMLASGAIVGTARVPGFYPLTLAITDSASPPATLIGTLALRVIILLSDTALVVSPPTLTLTVPRGARRIQARLGVASGRQSLEWAASSDAPWLSVMPPSGASPAIIEIGVAAESLAPGTYTGTVTVTMEGAPNSPARIPVTVTVPH